MTAGRVVVLNGTSSAGKTTLATNVRDRLAELGQCWVVFGIDDIISKLPFPFVRYGTAHVGAHAEAGLSFEMIDGELVRRLGPLGRSAMDAYRGTVAAAARAGLDVLVDEVLLRVEDWEAGQRELAGLDVRWVRVDADVAVLEERERARGDRLVGMARAQHAVVHRHPNYALTVDTGALAPDDAAAVVVAALG